MKLSKNFRQLYFIDLIIKLKRYLYQSFSYIITIIYLRLIAQYKNFSLIKTIGKGAGFYVSASKNDQKLFIKIANRQKSKQNEVKGYLNYYKNDQPFIKLENYKYCSLINFIAFKYQKFVTLAEWKNTNSNNNKNDQQFLADLLHIIEKLVTTKTNHNDISQLNIAVLKDKENISRLELFDFGITTIEDPNFKELFLKDLNNVITIAKSILRQESYDKFYQETSRYLA